MIRKGFPDKKLSTKSDTDQKNQGEHVNISGVSPVSQLSVCADPADHVSHRNHESEFGMLGKFLRKYFN